MSSAELYRATGHGQSAIAEMKARGIITPVSKSTWSAVETLGAMYRSLRARQSGEEDRSRKNKAEADEAEMRAMQATGEMVSIADAVQFWSDARIEIRQVIERAEFIPTESRHKLLTIIAALKERELENDK